MMNQLHTRLRLLRKEKGLTQAQLAENLRLPRVTYTHYELGKRTPDLDMIIQMARFFAVSVDYLIGNSDLRRWEKSDRYDAETELPLARKVAEQDCFAEYGESKNRADA